MPAKELKEPSHEEIACRAFLQWVGEGAPHGREKQNWFAAESEMMQQELAEEGIVWARETADLAHGYALVKARKEMLVLLDSPSRIVSQN